MPDSSGRTRVSDHFADRHLGLPGASGIGVGAIVGGGVLALAGVAFTFTGPSVVLAFALNGVIALLTAASFAEMSSKFPESGGMYIFAKRVVSIEAAFAIGWVVWFASIAAAALYALGFAFFLMLIVREACELVHADLPTLLASDQAISAIAVVGTLITALNLAVRKSGTGIWGNLIKLMVFAVLIVAGLIAMSRQPLAAQGAHFHPFFARGWQGLVQAMGVSFIALQGFDLIAAVAGEVREPERNVPRSMFLSLIVALAIYLPLLIVVTAVGIPAGLAPIAWVRQDPEAMVATAAHEFLGPVGYWLVLAAAVLAMLTALQSNLFAASRIAQAMARDRTLPQALRSLGARSGTPWRAVAASSVLALSLLLILPDVAQAGAAASLIFLISFALAHWTAILVRQRTGNRPPGFRTPCYPAVPVVGGACCLCLAVFQGVMVPAAGFIAAVWLALGGALFMTLFARRARVRDVARAAYNPELRRLRGKRATTLVPIANPQNGLALINLAATLSANVDDRLLALTIIVPPDSWNPASDARPFEQAEAVSRRVLTAAMELNVRTETMLSIAEDPVDEIARLAHHINCQLVVLGLSQLGETAHETPAQRLLGRLQMDIVVVRAHQATELIRIERVLVLVANLNLHDELRARLLSSLVRAGQRNVTYLRILPPRTPPETQRRVRRDLARLAADEIPTECQIEVLTSDDPLATATEYAQQFDLVVVGVQRLSANRKLFGHFTKHLAHNISQPMVVISRRG